MYFDQKEFGKRIQDPRKRAGMTQEQLAEKLQFDRTHIAKMETGLRACSIDTLLELSDLFEVSTDYLLRGENAMDEEKRWLMETAEKLRALSSKL